MAAKNGPEDKKIKILEALNRCLQEKPFNQTSIKDIAREAGVNHGLLHYYFTSKEDILIHYIDYIIDYYKGLFNDWFSGKDLENIDEKGLIAEFFSFMNGRITLNRELSKVFIEIWEIAVYHPAVKSKLQAAYREWITTLSEILQRAIGDAATANRISTAIVAFLEGIALFSIILDPASFDFPEVLTGFQRRIIEML